MILDKEVVNYVYENLLRGILTLDEDGDVKWTDKASEEDTERNRMAWQLHYSSRKDSKAWLASWDEAVRKYKELPLVKALL